MPAHSHLVTALLHSLLSTLGRFKTMAAPPADGRGRTDRGRRGQEPAVTKWEVIKYALDSNAYTIRFCAIILVLSLGASLALGLGIWFAHHLQGYAYSVNHK